MLAYHDIVPRGAPRRGDASLHLPQADFARQLDVLAHTHDVVSLTSLLNEPVPADRPRVAVTFDDAYTGALTAGIDELTQRGLPATIFVTPALLGTIPWWDRLADHRTGEIAPARRHHALKSLEGRHDLILEAAGEDTHEDEPGVSIGTEKLLMEVARQPGIALESHSWSHANLSVLGADALREELSRSIDWLRARLGVTPRYLSYPYGLFSDRVEAAAHAAGYVAAFRVDGGWMRKDDCTRPFALRRYNVPAGLSLDGFRVRLAGIATGT